nr:hypothetical protein [uncultured bacterium]
MSAKTTQAKTARAVPLELLADRCGQITGNFKPGFYFTHGWL